MRDSTKSRLLMLTGLTLLILASLAVSANAQAIYSPAIIFREAYDPGRSFEMKEDGTGKQYLSQCPANICGDLSHEGVPGKRFFLRVESNSNGSDSADIVVYSEDFVSRVVLSHDQSFYPAATAFWSRDGSRIAYYEWHCIETNADGSCQKSQDGIVAADVSRDVFGNPLALTNERRVFSAQSPDYLSGPSWAPDNQRLAFVWNKSFNTPSGIQFEWHGFAAYIPQDAAPLPPPTEIAFDNGGRSLGPLNFSPSARTDSQGHQIFKLALQRLTDTRPYARFDIFTTEIPAGYDGSYVLVSTRLTNSTNAKNFYGGGSVNWSPDGQWLAYVASSGAFGPSDIYKIRSDGKTKAVNLTNLKTNMAYLIKGWRP
jgi:Tol biopolymer transport system component